MTTDPVAGPSGSSSVAEESSGPARHTPGASPYHESSQFRNWRYSPEQLAQIRAELNKKSVEVVARNQKLEQKAQIELNHNPPNLPPAATYLSVDDELLLLRFYCTQISKICRKGFGLPAVVESTALSYLKRFYLKNSVMEWHPKTIMPTCLFLAAKTTNYPVLIGDFVPKFAKLQPEDVTDTEFLVAQSLGFEFWVRGPEKGLRGWSLELQEQSNPPISQIQALLPSALLSLSRSSLTDLEFIYSPSQISLACWYTASASLISDFLEWRYSTLPEAYGMSRDRLVEILEEIKAVILSVGVDEAGEPGVDLKRVKGVDRRLKGCTNPEKTPGTALYLQRKQQKEAEEAALRTAKSLKAAKELQDRDMVFGDIIQPTGPSSRPADRDGGGGGQKRKPLSPLITLPSPRSGRADEAKDSGGGAKKLKFTIGGTGARAHLAVSDAPGRGDVRLEDGGMGVPDEAMGMVVGGKGLKEVGRSLADEEE